MNLRRAVRLLAGCLALAALADSCSPLVTVENKTQFEVRAIVTNAGHSSVISPSPGESSVAEAEEGAYKVVVIPSKEWLDHAIATRQFLDDQLAHADTLTGEQLREVTRRFVEIALKIQEFEATAGQAQICSGQITQDAGGHVTVSTASDGSIVVACN
ncbi:MAG: hypothetical protein ABI847_00450 [Anaerolineales bacterium]